MMIDGKNKDDLYDEDAALYTVSICQHFLARMLWLHVIACDCMWLHVIAYICDCSTGRSYVCESACLRLNSKVLYGIIMYYIIYSCTLLMECYQNSPLASEETKFFDNPRLRWMNGFVLWRQSRHSSSWWLGMAENGWEAIAWLLLT